MWSAFEAFLNTSYKKANKHLSSVLLIIPTIGPWIYELQVLIRDADDEVDLVWVDGEVGIVPPWALVVGHTLNGQPIMTAIGYDDDTPVRLGLYTNGSSCAEYHKEKAGNTIWCSNSWKVATMKPCKETYIPRIIKIWEVSVLVSVVSSFINYSTHVQNPYSF